MHLRSRRFTYSNSRPDSVAPPCKFGLSDSRPAKQGRAPPGSWGISATDLSSLWGRKPRATPLFAAPLVCLPALPPTERSPPPRRQPPFGPGGSWTQEAGSLGPGAQGSPVPGAHPGWVMIDPRPAPTGPAARVSPAPGPAWRGLGSCVCAQVSGGGRAALPSEEGRWLQPQQS